MTSKRADTVECQSSPKSKSKPFPPRVDPALKTPSASVLPHGDRRPHHDRPPPSSARRRALRSVALTIAAFGLSGCTENYFANHYHEAVVPSDAGDDPIDTDPPILTDAGTKPSPPPPPPPPSNEEDASSPPASPRPLFPGAPLVNADRADLDLDVFGAIGNRYWFIVSDEQLERMNERYGGGGPIFLFNQYGDIYTPLGDGDLTYVDHLLVTPAGSLETADFGKVQTRLVGESTGRPWSRTSLPNLKIDSDEYQAGNRIGGVKHIRFNNAVVGSIFREKLALDVYRALGYPAPRATYAWVATNVWGSNVTVPYVLVESYKPQFCKRREDQLGGGCVNMWEFPGDITYGDFEAPASCQFSECDATRVLEFQDLVLDTPATEGFKTALEDYVDWDEMHRFQCLSWIVGTGDDAIHNTNNLVLVERADGKFQMLPYSVDISFGQDWYATVTLPGSSSLAAGCQGDPSCWEDTIATCEDLLQDFEAIDPVSMLDAQYESLEGAGMLRNGDEARYEALAEHLERRLTELWDELELNRDAPYYGQTCDYPLVDCGGYCAFPEDCYLCEEPGPGPVEGHAMMAAAAPDGIVIGVPPNEPPPPGGDLDAGGPIQCLEQVDLY